MEPNTLRPRLPEAMGLLPVRERWAQAKIALRGEEDVPPSKFGLSSLAMLRPRIGIRLWRGRPWIERAVLLTNLFNHRQTPTELGWSVLRTQVEDFRGGDMTYDSHNGTDLSIPVGTTVTTAAPGQVVQVISEFNRGGLKIFIDHGRGLMTCYAHLARALVEPGQVLERGQPIAVSGYSGLDGFVTFPFGVPHVHFNTWLNGVPVDPFAREGEESLWRGGVPLPPDSAQGERFEPSTYDAEAVHEVVAACKTESVRAKLEAVESPDQRAALTVIEMNYYPTRFPAQPNVYGTAWDRAPRLDLPFLASAFDRAVFVDEPGGATPS
ncbi:MAG: M23 family metallopeptidase [Deltaproteobacteria bacterium]|nr:M23 family metallopeptidase [Deltaproteobacteria bacterium]